MTGLFVTLAGVAVSLTVVGGITLGEQQLGNDLSAFCQTWSAQQGTPVPQDCQ